MSLPVLLIAVLGLAALAYLFARGRVLALVGGDARLLQSRPVHYGWHGALLTALPALVLLMAWSVAEPVILQHQLASALPDESEGARDLWLADAHRVAHGFDQAVAQGLASEAEIAALATGGTELGTLLHATGVATGAGVEAPVLHAAQRLRALAAQSALWRAVAVLAVALGGAGVAFVLSRPELRARNRVERVVRAMLFLAASVAILTTIGIVVSLATGAGRFFTLYPVDDFLFGTDWSPRFGGGSSFGLLPLLWGTLYVSLIAMAVAVPLGLMTAIYLAEYAGQRIRAAVKPVVEVIAGIPTVVFGLFALVTLGPMLRDWFASPMGLGTSATSVMTAGIAIGILNIPFISSLADDILTAVPQSLRDGSDGLGATRSETIRLVVLPAALPGIVGAVLMASSRAIGETMIVTMGAGAAAKMDLNPFEAMTTITVKIVGQLTGDTAFDSPETLVAFALGLTLFVLTLALNILALWIVRRYREQYE